MWGLDVWVQSDVRKLTHFEPRVHVFEADCYKVAPSKLGLQPGTMDIVIDDALHGQEAIETALAAWWPLVKPGGFYVIEDVEWERPSSKPFLAWLWHMVNGGPISLLETPLSPATEKILHENHAFFVDSLFGHRNFTALRRSQAGDGSPNLPWSGARWTIDRTHHNSHLAVIQKRALGHPSRPFDMKTGAQAMRGTPLTRAKHLLREARARAVSH